MDFALTEHQLELQSATQAFCDANFPFSRVAALENNPVERDSWARLAAMDVFRLAGPADRDGLGLGLVEAAVVFEVLGSHLVPGPLVWSALATIHLGQFAAGTAIVTGIDLPDPATDPALVEHAADCDAIVVLREHGVFAVGRDAIASCRVVTPIDPLTPVALVTSLAGGTRAADGIVADDIRRTGTVLTSALLVGIAGRALDAAVAHANERVQFGQSIGSFQAIKHLLADMYVRTSLARGATYAAAAIADDPECGDLASAAAAAKLVAADAAIRNAKSCIQVHGGMGFTWEMIPHYLLKRAWVLEQSFGSRTELAETVARQLASEVAS